MLNTRLVLLVLFVVLGVAWSLRTRGGWQPPQGNGPYNPNPSRPRYRRFVFPNQYVPAKCKTDNHPLFEEVQNEQTMPPAFFYAKKKYSEPRFY